MKIVWFNRCFTTLYHTINGIKSMFGDNIKVLGTSTNPNHGWREACDEFYMEHPGAGLEYVKWAAQFCNEHNVDIFFVKANRVDIAKHREVFESIVNHPVKLVLNSYDTQVIVDDKAGLYDKLLADKVGYMESTSSKQVQIRVPNYYKFKISEISIELLNSLIDKWGSVCYKFNKDEGAGSFRKVVRDKKEHRAMFYPTPAISAEQALEELNDYKKEHGDIELIVMEVLDEPEISVDCYNSEKGFVAVPRYKDSKRVQVITHIPELEEQCKVLQEVFGFEYPWNAQFRQNRDGESCLLEINPRMSGGSYVGKLVGCWHCEYLMKDLLGIDYTISDFNTAKVTQIETTVLMTAEKEPKDKNK